MNSRISSFASKALAYARRAAFVFSGDFSVAAAFSVLQFLLIVPIALIEDLPVKDYEKWQKTSETLCWLALSCAAGVLAATSCVFVTKKKWIHALSGAAGAVLARLLLLMGEKTHGRMIEYFGLLALLAITFMYLLYSGAKKEGALIYAFSRLVNAVIAAHIVFAGLFSCESFFLSLVLDASEHLGLAAAITYAFCACVVGAFFFLSGLNADSAKNAGLSRIERGWYHYCLAPIFLIYILMLYAYFLKITLALSLPDGVINPFVTIACAAYMFMYLSQRQFDDTFTRAFYKASHFVMIPLVVMQCVAIGTRVSAYGLTGTRVCSMGCVIIELSFIALAAFKGGLHIRKAFVIAGAVVFALMIQPFGAERIAVASQVSRLEEILSRNSMLDSLTGVLLPAKSSEQLSIGDIHSIINIYDYLDDRNGLPGYLEGKPFSDALGFEHSLKHKASNTEFKEYLFTLGTKSVEIGGYRSLQNFSGSNCFRLHDPRNESSLEEGRPLPPLADGGPARTEVFLTYGESELNVTDFLWDAIPFARPVLEFMPDEETRIVFSYLSFTYAESDRSLNHVSMEYYVLKR